MAHRPQSGRINSDLKFDNLTTHMWVTQTYLGDVEPQAHLFVYYLFENYNHEQIEFTKAVQARQRELGRAFGDDVSVLMPNPEDADQIESEIKGRLRILWSELRDKLPGLLCATKPLKEFNVKEGDYHFISLKNQEAKDASIAVARVRALANEQLAWDYAQIEKATPSDSNEFLSRLFEAVEIKPGIGFVKLDFKKLITRP